MDITPEEIARWQKNTALYAHEPTSNRIIAHLLGLLASVECSAKCMQELPIGKTKSSDNALLRDMAGIISDKLKPYAGLVTTREEKDDE